MKSSTVESKFKLFENLDASARRDFLQKAVQLVKREDPDGYYLHALALISELIEAATTKARE